MLEIKNNSSLLIKKGDTNNGNIAYYALNIYSDSQGESYLKKVGNYVFYDDNTDAYLLNYNGKDSTLSLPNYTKPYGIYKQAFYGNKNIKNITIPSNVSNVGDSAFFGCTKLETVTWNAQKCAFAGSYNNEIFSDCYNFKTLILGDGVKEIPIRTFDKCDSLKKIIWNAKDCIYTNNNHSSIFRDCEELIEVIVGEGVQALPDDSFSGCSSLSQITLPSSLTSIGAGAFRYDRAISRIIYNGTINQWFKITTGSYWSDNTSNYTLYCTDGYLTWYNSSGMFSAHYY